MLLFALPWALAAATSALDARAEADATTRLAFEPAPLSALVAAASQDSGAGAKQSGGGFSYSYIQVGYQTTDYDLLPDASTGYGARLSFGLLKFLYVFGSYEMETIEVGPVDVDATTLSAGAGAHFALAPALDVVVEAAFIDQTVEAPGGDIDDTGFTGMAGIRWMALPWENGGLELDAGYRMISSEAEPSAALNNDDTASGFEGGLRAHMGAFSIGATYAMIEDDSRLAANLRFSF